MVAIIFALITFIFWGIGDIFTTQAARKMGSINSTFYAYIVTFFLSFVVVPFELTQLKHLSLELLLIIFLLSFFQFFGFFIFNEALRIGNSSLVGTITGAFTSLVIILSLIFFREKINVFQTISIIIIFIGLILSLLNFSDLSDKKKIFTKANLYAFISMACYAVSFTFIKIPVQRLGFFWPAFLVNSFSIVYILILGFKKIKMVKFDSKSGIVPASLAGIILTTGYFTFNLGINIGYSSVVAAIAGAYPALFALLAFYIFKDPITRQQKNGNDYNADRNSFAFRFERLK